MIFMSTSCSDRGYLMDYYYQSDFYTQDAIEQRRNEAVILENRSRGTANQKCDQVQIETLQPEVNGPINQPQDFSQMAAQEHYSLRWNDHQNQILLAFEALLQTKSLVDVTLVCAETSIRAHKVVLSACSPFFQRVFAENPCKHPVIVLKDFNGWVVQAIVDFMYRGEISVPQERLQTLIQAGESLQVRGLIDHSVTGNTPTPAASPDDFNGLICNREGSVKGDTAAFLNFKHYYEPEIYMDGSYGNYISPMPRRKQARPRRRSGDFSPLNNGENPTDDNFDTENNKNFKNIDEKETERGDKVSLSKSSSVVSLDTAAEEPEDLCTKADIDNGEENCVSAKPKLSASGRSVEIDEDSEGVQKDSAMTGASGNHHSAKRSSGSGAIKEKSGESNGSRIVLSLKDIRHFSNASSDNQRAQHLMANRFLNQSPTTLLKTMSNHLGLSAAAAAAVSGRLSPKSLADAKFNAMQFRGPPMDLTGSRHGKFYSSRGHDDGHDDDEDEDEEEDEQQEKSVADEAMDADSGDEGKQQQEEIVDGRKLSPKEAKSMRRERNSSHQSEMEDNNNNNRLDMFMSMNGPSALLMEHMDFNKHRQQLFQQHHQQQLNGMEASLKSHHGSHNRTSSSSSSSGPHDLLADSRKNHNESTPVGNSHNRAKDFSMSLPPPFNMQQPGDAHPPFSMPSVSSLALTPPHMFGLDTPLGLFPPHHGMDPSKLYSPLMEMSDPRGMHPEQQPYLKKKGKFLGRPKGQHSAPRGGPPRSWTNAELTEALQHVWNKKMTTSQASRIFGIPYNSLLMYVRGKYGKSLKLEQLRKDCISGPPIELLQMGVNKNGGSNNNNSSNNGTSSNGNNKDNNGSGGGGGSSSNKELKDFEMNLSGSGGGGPEIHNDMPMFNPFQANFYPDFAGFPGLPLSMLNLLPPESRHAAAHLPNNMEDEDDCKSEVSPASL